MKTFSVAMTEILHQELFHHLKRHDLQEDLCFALWNDSQGAVRQTAVLADVILPEAGDRQVHGNVSFNSQYLDRVLALAAKKQMGIAFLHNHFTPGWQDMSQADIRTEEYLAPIVKATTRMPLVGMTMGIDGAWSSRRWEKTRAQKWERQGCESVRVVGNRFAITFNDTLLKRPKISARLSRTVSAWGDETQTTLSRLKIGIIGAGSVGSVIAESLKKIGVRWIKLIDFDTLEERNLDRTLHARSKDIGQAKVNVLATALKKEMLLEGSVVEPVEYSIIEELAFRKALDCDILFSCVDRPWPRFLLDRVAYAHLIPVIDGGILVETNSTNSKLMAADWKTNLVGPRRPCLECLGQYEPDEVALEISGMLDDRSYIAGLSREHFIHRNENVFAFSLGLGFLELQQLLSFVVAPFGLANIGGKVYHFVTGELEKEKVVRCSDNCRKKHYLAEGDKGTAGLTTRHLLAEEAREKRKGKE